MYRADGAKVGCPIASRQASANCVTIATAAFGSIYISSTANRQLQVNALSTLTGECLMNALRQSTRLLRRYPLQQARAAHQDSTAVDTEHRVDGEIGIASGAPENIYKRQVYLSDLSFAVVPARVLCRSSLCTTGQPTQFLTSDAGHNLFPSTHFWPAREGQHRRCFRQWAQLEAHLRDAAKVSQRSLRSREPPAHQGSVWQIALSQWKPQNQNSSWHADGRIP